jgi:hypothetical protein
MRELGHGAEKYESGRNELATVDRDRSGAPVKSELGEVGNVAYPKRGYPHRVVDEAREVVAELWA